MVRSPMAHVAYSRSESGHKEVTAMNKWQKMFGVFGVVATAALFIFPPQIVSSDNVRFLFITEGYPIDWLKLFLWFLGIVFVTGLGIAINKEEHR